MLFSVVCFLRPSFPSDRRQTGQLQHLTNNFLNGCSVHAEPTDLRAPMLNPSNPRLQCPQQIPQTATILECQKNKP